MTSNTLFAYSVVGADASLFDLPFQWFFTLSFSFAGILEHLRLQIAPLPLYFCTSVVEQLGRFSG